MSTKKFKEHSLKGWGGTSLIQNDYSKVILKTVLLVGFFLLFFFTHFHKILQRFQKNKQINEQISKTNFNSAHLRLPAKDMRVIL